METTHGSFIIQLDRAAAPKTCDAFLRAVESKSLDDTRLTWRSIGNRKLIDKDKKAGDLPMATKVNFKIRPRLVWVDEVPKPDTVVQRGDLCIDQKDGQQSAEVVISQLQSNVSTSGLLPIGRVVDGWEEVDRLCDGRWIKKDGLPPQYGGRFPSLFLEENVVKTRTVKVVP